MPAAAAVESSTGTNVVIGRSRKWRLRDTTEQTHKPPASKPPVHLAESPSLPQTPPSDEGAAGVLPSSPESWNSSRRDSH